MISRMMSTQAKIVTLSNDVWSKYVSVALKGEETNNKNNNVFLDSSINTLTVTPTGSPMQGSFSPFTTDWSVYFNGSSNLAVSNGILALGSGDFTVEAWVNISSFLAYGCFFDTRTTNTSGSGFYLRQGPTLGTIGIGQGSGVTSNTTTTVSLNTWNHIAAVRSSGTVTIYINGVSSASVTLAQNFTDSNVLIGKAIDGYNTTGLISNLRVVKGVALYTANFVPSTEPLSAVTGTTLLACQACRFIDSSANNFTLTVTGAPKTIARPSLVNSGSTYFNGTTDYLTVPNLPNLCTGNTDFTIECWVYPTLLTGSQYGRPIICLTIVPYGVRLVLRYAINGSTYNIYGFNGSAYLGTGGTNFGTPILHTWTHIALVRNSNTFTVFINGISAFSTLNAISLTGYTTGYVGYYQDGTTPLFNGYMSNIRIIQGTALYTTNFSVPTSPLTAVTNTQLLLKGTNAGIVDSSNMQNWVTYGNAKISTDTKKFGTGSVSFDGINSRIVSNPGINFGSSDFTMETWVNLSSTQTAANPFILNNNDGNSWAANLWVLHSKHPTAGAKLSFWCYNALSTGPILTSFSDLNDNTWHHVALVRSGTSFKLFVDGILNSRYTSSASMDAGTANYIGCFGHLNANGWTKGYMDDLRITSGVVRYTESFTPAINPNVSLEPLGPYAVLQLNAEDMGTGTFIDSGPNALTITKNGNPIQGSFSPFGYFSTVFDSRSIDFYGDATNMAFSTGDFTIETFMRIDNFISSFYIYDSNGGNKRSNYSPTRIGLYLVDLSTMSVVVREAGVNFTVPTFVLNRWYHIALVRSGGSRRFYIDGVQVYTVADTNDYRNDTGRPSIGGEGYGGTTSPSKVLLSNLRVTKSEVYTGSSFIVPTSQLQVLANTQLLTFQSNRLGDSSQNNFTFITPYGAPQVINQSPLIKVEYNPTVLSGSMYFNGSTDFLSVSAGTIPSGTESFTIEMWVNFSTLTFSGFVGLYCSETTGALEVYINNVTAEIRLATVGVTTYLSYLYSNFKINFWYHLAFVRNGNIFTMYVNGVSVNTLTSVNSITASSGIEYVGRLTATTGSFNGYISNLRSVRGTAIYTDNFVVPTVPLAAVTNTKLLLYGTNAKLVDKTCTNNLILNGATTVSTSQFKYGAASMYFPGGSGNYIHAPDRPELRIGTQDFMIEFWFYLTTGGINNILIGKGYTTGFQLYLNPSNRLSVDTSGTGRIYTASTYAVSTWHHIRVTRSAGFLRLYKNGILDGEAADTNNISDATSPLCFGKDTVSSNLAGYIDDFRFIIGKTKQAFNLPTELL
jgi:hypothetical protein